MSFQPESSENLKPKFEVIKKQESFTSIRLVLGKLKENQETDKSVMQSSLPEERTLSDKKIQSLSSIREEPHDLSQMNHLERERLLNERHVQEQKEKERQRLLKQYEGNKDQINVQNDLYQYNYLQQLQSIGSKSSNLQKDLSAFEVKFEKLWKLSNDNPNNLDPTRDLQFINQVCLKWDFLLSQKNKFYFEDMIKDSLVKIHYGTADHLDTYKVGKIAKIIKGEPYNLNNISSNIYLVINVEVDSQWQVKLPSVSNKDINERECYQLIDQLSYQKDQPFDWKQIQFLIEKIERFKNYKITQSDEVQIIDKKIRDLNNNTLQDFISKKELLESKILVLEQDNQNANKNKEEIIQHSKQEIERLKQIIIQKQKEINAWMQQTQYYQFQSLNESEKWIFERKKAQPINMWNIDIEQVKNTENINLIQKQDSLQNLPSQIIDNKLENFLQQFQYPLEIDDCIENFLKQIQIIQ